MIRRITWEQAEAIHPTCSAAWDCTGLTARAVFEFDGLGFGARVVAVVAGANAHTRHFDPRVGLWVTSFHLPMARTPTELCCLQWFRERWVQHHGNFTWEWDANRRRMVPQRWQCHDPRCDMPRGHAGDHYCSWYAGHGNIGEESWPDGADPDAAEDPTTISAALGYG